MARHWFGGSQADQVVTRYDLGSHGLVALAAGVKVTFFDAETDGTQYVDLLLDGITPGSFITTDDDGYVPRFQGPDAVQSMWADVGSDQPRRIMVTTDAAIDLSSQLATRIATVEKGAVNGVAELDGDGKVPLVRLPETLVRTSDLPINAADYASIADALGASTAGRSVFVPAGAYSISSPLTVPAGVTLQLDSGATITNTDETQSAIILNTGSAIRGGKIVSPAVFDATTGGDWTYAVIYIPGNGATVAGVTLENVPRVGIGFEGDDGIVVNCRITGNYPAANWTGTETSHFGIALDPSGSAVDGNLVVSGNIVKSCVQGVFVGNFGTGVGRNVCVTGNVFEGCHNHGVYMTSGNAHQVVGNSFNRCQKPIIVTGSAHVVADNSMWTSATGGELDKVGIGVRNATNCVIEGNTIIGDSTSDNLAISLDNTSGGVELSRNIVRGNVITLAATASSHAAIRVGNPSTTEINRDNRVEGNVIRAPGISGVSSGMIEVQSKVGFTGTGNAVCHNSLVLIGASHGVVLTRQSYAAVLGNTIRLEHDAAAGSTLIMTRLVGSADCQVRHNTFITTSAWGANVTMQGVRENDSSCDRNILGPNVGKWDLTKLTSATEIVQSVPGNASLVGVDVGEYAAATTLGSVTGKVEVRDAKGAIKGYAPLYDTIT